MKLTGEADDVFAQSLAYIGMSAAFFMFLSPLVTVRRIWKESSVLEFSELPYIVSTCNCALWIIYGLVTPGRFILALTNLLGLILQIMYCSIFYYFSDGNVHKRVKQRLIGIWCFIISIVIVAFIIRPPLGKGFLGNGESAISELLGILASAFNTAMYGSPLAIMHQVIKTKSVEFMPLPLTIMTSCCCILWGIYAYYVGDIFVAVPNAVGIGLCFFQIIFYAYYCGAMETKNEYTKAELDKMLDSVTMNIDDVSNKLRVEKQFQIEKQI